MHHGVRAAAAAADLVMSLLEGKTLSCCQVKQHDTCEQEMTLACLPRLNLEPETASCWPARVGRKSEMDASIFVVSIFSSFPHNSTIVLIVCVRKHKKHICMLTDVTQDCWSNLVMTLKTANQGSLRSHRLCDQIFELQGGDSDHICWWLCTRKADFLKKVHLWNQLCVFVSTFTLTQLFHVLFMVWGELTPENSVGLH